MLRTGYPVCRSGSRRVVRHRSDGSAPNCPAHQPLHESWCSSPHENGQDFVARFFGRAGSVLVRPHDGAVEKYLLKVCVLAKRGEVCLPDPFVCPAREAPEYRIPWSKGWWEITPGCPGSRHPDYRFNKQSIIGTGTATISGLAVQHRFYSRPWSSRNNNLAIPSSIQKTGCKHNYPFVNSALITNVHTL